MKALVAALALAACTKADPSPPPTPSPAPQPQPVPTVPLDAAVVAIDAPPVDDTLITRTRFGPYQAGEPVTLALLKDRFKLAFESIEFGGSEGADDGRSAWHAKTPPDADDGMVSRLLVTKDGKLWVTSSPTAFHDEHGLRPGIASDKLVATIKDLKCVNIEGEEPEFSCWSKAAPELLYRGQHGYRLGDRFSIAELADLQLVVEAFHWRPKP